MDTLIGGVLAELRKEKGFMQKDVAAKLSTCGFNTNAKTIYNWEKGLAQPAIQQFLALCRIFDVDDILWRFAGIHTGPYAGLNEGGRQKAREFIDLLFRIDEYRDDPIEVREAPRLYRLYDIPVSAGTGNFLDESGYEMIEAPDFVPSHADYALRISGDSMEPLFQDGQVVWIESREMLNNGEIGIFMYDGCVYCKKLVHADGVSILRSLNEKYDDIEVNVEYGVTALGRVVA